jgi:transcriptional regulator with XRE-family HTH domain
MNIQHVFAENMKALRSERRYTQEELSQISGLHRTYIGGVEQERINVSLKNIGKIASALNTNPAFFFCKP